MVIKKSLNLNGRPHVKVIGDAASQFFLSSAFTLKRKNMRKDFRIESSAPLTLKAPIIAAYLIGVVHHVQMCATLPQA